MLTYILKSALLLGILYSCYYILLNKETFHRFNRIVLVSIMLISLGLPLVKVVTERPTVINMEFQNLQSRMTSTMNGGMLEGVEITADKTKGMTWGEVLSIIYYIGVAVSLLLTVIQIIALLKYIKGGLRHTDSEGNTIILTPGNISPYSVFRFIVMSVDDYEHDRQSILTHEQEHIRLHHSLDLILLEVVKTLQWFNPFVWFLAVNLRSLHEYEADEAVINKGIDAKQYQQLLVTKAVGNRLQPFANNLRRGSLKNRIIMMYKKKSTRWMMLKALFVIPVAAMAISAFAIPKLAKPVNDVIEKVKSEPIAVPPDTCKAKVEMMTFKPDEVLDMHETSDDIFIMDGKEITLAEFRKINEEDIDNMCVCSGSVAQGYAERQLGRKVKGRIIIMETKTYAQNKADTLDALVQKIPGADVSADGTIRLNGKEVKSVQMNGKELLDNGDVFLECETNAEFPGGKEALMKFLAQNIKYPEAASRVGAQGRIIVSFIVEQDGSITNIKPDDDDKYNKIEQNEVTANSLKQGDSENADDQKAAQQALREEAVRVIKAMPKWSPAIQQGKKVRFMTAIPITFRGTHDSNGDEVLYAPEKMPEFKGGMSGLMSHLGSNIKYPALAQEIHLSGRVLVRFVVGKQGNVYDIKILKSAGPENSADYKWKDKNNQPIAAPTGKTLEKFQKNYAEANKQLNVEAIRCIESTSGLWTPGTQNDEPVNVQYTLPISFRLK